MGKFIGPRFGSRYKFKEKVKWITKKSPANAGLFLG
jgi:hypothetical protein